MATRWEHGYKKCTQLHVEIVCDVFFVQGAVWLVTDGL